MAEQYQEDKTTSPIIMMSTRQVVQVVLLGIFVGLLTWALAYALERYVLKVFLCSDSQLGCNASSTYAYIAAAVIAAGVGLFGLVKLFVYRPLLVVLAATITMWGLLPLVTPLPLYVVLLSTAGLTALAYITFAWLAHVRLFWLALVLLLGVVILARVILMA